MAAQNKSTDKRIINMRITFEKYKTLVMIYIYFREFTGKTVKTISDVTCELLFSKDDNWIGITIINGLENNSEVILPKLKDFSALNDIKFEQSERQITILFNADSAAYSRIKNICNIDHNDDGLFGIEVMLNNFSNKTNAIEPFTTFR